LGTNPTAYWDFGADGTTNRLAVTNLGTAESFPLLKVSGGVSSGFVVTDVTTGAVVQFSRLIPVGSQVTVNQRTGRASIDGQSDVSANITIRQFFSIPPGQTHILQFTPLGPSGGPKLFVTLAPAF
jgi:phage-related protein